MNMHPQVQLLFYYCFEVSSVVPQIFTEPVGIAFHINHISFVCIGNMPNFEIPRHMDEHGVDFCEDLLPWSDTLPVECRKQLE